MIISRMSSVASGGATRAFALGRDPRRGRRRGGVPQRPVDERHGRARQRRGTPCRLLLGQGPAAGELRRLAACAEEVPARVQRRRAARELEAPVDVRAARAAASSIDASASSSAVRRRRRRGARHAAMHCRRGRGSRCDGGASVIRLPDAHGVPRGLWLGSAAGTAPALPPMPLDVWDWLEVAAACRASSPPTVEQFVPQMLNSKRSAASTSRRAATRARKSSRAASTAARSSDARFVFDVDAPASPGRGGLSPAMTPPSRRAWSSMPRRPATPAARCWSRSSSPPPMLALHLRAADGPPLRRAALPYALPSKRTLEPRAHVHLLPRRASRLLRCASAIAAMQQHAAANAIRSLQAALAAPKRRWHANT